MQDRARPHSVQLMPQPLATIPRCFARSADAADATMGLDYKVRCDECVEAPLVMTCRKRAVPKRAGHYAGFCCVCPGRRTGAVRCAIAQAVVWQWAGYPLSSHDLAPDPSSAVARDGGDYQMKANGCRRRRRR